MARRSGCVRLSFLIPTGYLPVPDSGIICGKFDADPFTVNSPMCSVVSGAVNVIEALQLLPGARIFMH